MKLPDENQKNIFLLGLAILFGWMIIIILCSAPQLFFNFLKYKVCCCFYSKDRRNQEKIKQAKEKVRSASRCFLSTSLAADPSAILLSQVNIGKELSPQPPPTIAYRGAFMHSIDIPDPIQEESRGNSMEPSSSLDREKLVQSDETLPRDETMTSIV